MHLLVLILLMTSGLSIAHGARAQRSSIRSLCQDPTLVGQVGFALSCRDELGQCYRTVIPLPYCLGALANGTLVAQQDGFYHRSCTGCALEMPDGFAFSCTCRGSDAKTVIDLDGVLTIDRWNLQCGQQRGYRLGYGQPGGRGSRKWTWAGTRREPARLHA